MTEGYYRFPTIYRDTVVFVSEDDLWQVSRAGGAARRLTSNLGEVTHPVLSPDGAWLAFVGREEGETEVYVMPAEGGQARRLTYLNSKCRVVGWTPDGQQIIFTSTYGQVAYSEYGLFTIPYDSLNGAVTVMPYGPARAITFGPAGQVVIGRNIQDPANWKRYRGGTTGHLWIDVQGDGNFVRFLDGVQGNIASPMWVTASSASAQDRLFFISDHEGIGNLYSCAVDGTDLRRHTDHEDFYVRNPTSDGAAIVYHVGGALYYYDVATDQEQKIELTYHSPRVQRNRRFVDPVRYWDSVRLHPSGKAMALTTRGKAFAFFNHEGPVLQYGKRSGVRYRLPEWTNDKEHLILLSDEPGEEMIEIHPLDPQGTMRRLDHLDIGRAVTLKLSPVQDLLAITNHRHELLLVNLQTSDLTVVDRSPYRPIAGVDWSPDGRWLAYGYGATDKTTAIRIYRLADPDAADEAARQSAIYTVTRPVLHDVNPAFDPAGNYLYFLSYREFNPVYDGLHLELGFPWGMRPYLITLRAELPNPFIPQPEMDEDEEEGEAQDERAEDEQSVPAADDEEADGLAEDDGEEDEDDVTTASCAHPHLKSQRKGQPFFRTALTQELPPDAAFPGLDLAREGKSKEKAEKTEQGAKANRANGKVKPIRIDLEGIERRIVAFPVPDGRYGQIAGVPHKAIFTVFPVQGALDSDNDSDEEAASVGALRSYNFKEYKGETLAEDVAWFQLSENRKKLLYVSHRRLRVINAGEKPLSDTGPYRRTGWINLHRVKVSIEPQSEWEQMFREAWRLQRDHFWTEDMSKVDWQMVYQRYFPLIARVSTRSEFSDLMWEMQGELGTSHAYEYGGDYRSRPYFSQGFLGATFTWDGAAGGYRVGEPIIGDPWDTERTSPLTAPGLDIQPGDLLLAINGQRLDEQTSPAQLLVNQAGQEVLLTLAPRPAAADRQNGAAAVTQMTVSGASDVPTAADDQQGEMAQNASTEKAQPRSMVVCAIESEMPARYRAWVEANRRQVHEASQGRVGYVHIPDMDVSGYAEFHRGYLAEVDRDALVVDVRYNAGGHVSQLLLEKLARRRLGYDLSRWGGLSAYPSDSVAGPLVAITNEHAGSDGDIFCHSFKLMKLGPLIGKRTWGGVVGISPHHTLVDGTVTTQPEYSFWFKDVGWNLENYGTEPDIEVDITPQDYRVGRDSQLERAIEEILRLLAEHPITKPDVATRPSRALPKLPPRLNSL